MNETETKLATLDTRLAYVERDVQRLGDRLTGSKQKADATVERLREGMQKLEVAVAGLASGLDKDLAALRRLIWWALGIGATVGIGLVSLLQPLRGAHRMIDRAKQTELMRVREEISRCRTEMLNGGPTSASAAGHIPGLLAWEERVDSIHTWPLDLSTLMRFSLLVLLAVGSWLGGAIVERLLGIAWD